MEHILQLIRHAQWRWDWVAAANSMGFHSPSEALRTLATSIQKAQEASIELTSIFRKYDIPYPVDMPDISTKEKAQEYIGLDMEQIRGEKEEWKKEVLPQWLSQE